MSALREPRYSRPSEARRDEPLSYVVAGRLKLGLEGTPSNPTPKKSLAEGLIPAFGTFSIGPIDRRSAACCVSILRMKSAITGAAGPSDCWQPRLGFDPT
jgi:hypothetical protein